VIGNLGGMKTIQARIEEHVDTLIGNLNALVRELAMAAIAERMGGRPPVEKRQRMAAAHRKPEEIAALTEDLYAEVCRSPGQTMQTLSGAIGHPSALLSRPMRKLMGASRVKKAGQRNFTRYFPVGQNAEGRRRKAL
jgi:hypothetical protein